MGLNVIGQDVATQVTIKDANGNPVNAVSVTCTIIDPAGNSTTPTPLLISPGTYQAVVSSVSLAGTYEVRWAGISSTAANFAYEDQFSVRPQGLTQVVDLSSVKTQLSLPASDVSNDIELEGFIVAATEMIRDICGPIFPESHTEWCTGGVSTFSVDWKPLISIQSITEYYGLSAFAISEQPLGSQTNAFGFTVDYTTGEITRRTFGGAPALWALGRKNVKIVYTAGMTSIPFAVRLATLRLIQHWWGQFKSQRGPRRGMGNGLDSETSTPMGFAVPDAVVELLAPWRRPPGVA